VALTLTEEQRIRQLDFTTYVTRPVYVRATRTSIPMFGTANDLVFVSYSTVWIVEKDGMFSQMSDEDFNATFERLP
jgi:hypothetical protein